VGFGLAMLAASALVHCSNFGSGDPAATVEAGTEDATDAAPQDPREAAPQDGGLEARVRTGVACGSFETRCKVGEKCCQGLMGAPLCAPNCAAADASNVVLECGQTSDCAADEVCCAAQNAGCFTYLAGSTCLPFRNCRLCGGAEEGGAARLCDPTAKADCPARSTCTHDFQSQIYKACSY